MLLALDVLFLPVDLTPVVSENFFSGLINPALAGQKKEVGLLASLYAFDTKFLVLKGGFSLKRFGVGAGFVYRYLPPFEVEDPELGNFVFKYSDGYGLGGVSYNFGFLRVGALLKSVFLSNSLENLTWFVFDVGAVYFSKYFVTGLAISNIGAFDYPIAKILWFGETLFWKDPKGIVIKGGLALSYSKYSDLMLSAGLAGSYKKVQLNSALNIGPQLEKFCLGVGYNFLKTIDVNYSVSLSSIGSVFHRVSFSAMF